MSIAPSSSVKNATAGEPKSIVQMVSAITPRIAQALLEQGQRGNQVSKDRVTAFAQEMAKGTFKPSVPILFLFSDDGEIVDGLEILHAIIQSGLSLQLQCEFGW
jgi:hypothetical protein